MEITVDKLAMFRESYNPKNTKLNLNIDWSVEYTHTDPKVIEYDIVLKSDEYLNLSFKVGGLVRLGDCEEFIQHDCSQIIFHHACDMLMNIISLTRQSDYELFSGESNSAVNLSATF